MAKTHSDKNLSDIEVYVTTDYDQFKKLKGNRKINQSHVDKMVASMKRGYAKNKTWTITIITANENFEIADGQHRLEAHRQCDAPIHYIIQKGITVQDIQELNINSANWNPEDYMNSYCELGNPTYLKYRQFKNKYGLNHDACLQLLCGNQIVGGDLSRSLRVKFRSGDLHIKNYETAELFAQKILSLEKFTKDYKSKSFFHAMMILSRNENFNFDEFVRKLNGQPLALKRCASASQYIELIEEIYNYHRSKKINLRY